MDTNFFFSSEVFSLFKYVTLVQGLQKKFPHLSEDIKALHILMEIRQQPGEDEETVRRKVITHKVTIAKKQAIQLHILGGLERGIDMIYGSIH